jgi:hypothetical protein
MSASSGHILAHQSRPAERGWVGLFSRPLIDWLENENQLAQLCSSFVSESLEWHRCRDEKLAPQVYVVRLWAAPSERGGPLGSLVIIATPGQGLRASFVSASGGLAKEFRPDLFDGDWGYGPYFHQTFVERRARWFRLPEIPFPKSTWLNTADLGNEPDLHLLEPDDIVTSDYGDLRILGIDSDILRARREQDPDMWCESGDPPPLEPWQEIRIPWRDLYTATGHLRLHVKYTRGC